MFKGLNSPIVENLDLRLELRLKTKKKRTMIRYLFIFSLHWSYIDLAFLDISKRLKADPEQTQANLLKTQEFVN